MTETSHKSFWADFRRFFIRGLATLLPTILTFVLLFKCFEFIHNNISIYITDGASYVVVQATKNHPHWGKIPAINEEDVRSYIQAHRPSLDAKNPGDIQSLLENPAELNRMRYWKLQKQWRGWPGAVIGFIFAIVIVYITGRLLASYLGHKLWQGFEGTVQQVPGFKQVYPHVKQVTEFLLGDQKKLEFKRVVAIPYPRQGLWSLAFVTGNGFSRLNERDNEQYLTVFVPSSPTPFTGYVVHVPQSEVVDMSISVEEAFRFTVTGGVLRPGSQNAPLEKIIIETGPAVEEVVLTHGKGE